MGKYDRYFDIMIKYARKLLNVNRQDKLLPYLEDDRISIQYDVASLLYNFTLKGAWLFFKELAACLLKLVCQGNSVILDCPHSEY